MWPRSYICLVLSRLSPIARGVFPPSLAPCVRPSFLTLPLGGITLALRQVEISFYLLRRLLGVKTQEGGKQVMVFYFNIYLKRSETRSKSALRWMVCLQKKTFFQAGRTCILLTFV